MNILTLTFSLKTFELLEPILIEHYLCNDSTINIFVKNEPKNSILCTKPYAYTYIFINQKK